MKNFAGVLLASAISSLQIATAEAGPVCDGPNCIQTKTSGDITPAFDLLHTQVIGAAGDAVFTHQLNGPAGSLKPKTKGQLGGADVYSYVWPTSIDSSTVGFDDKQGILALAVTSHPDFDDTPRVDENGDGKPDNDGAEWHSHWVVLVSDEACGKGGLKVKDIPENSKARLPATWPGLPILIDSPGYKPAMTENSVEVRVPKTALRTTSSFNFDGVTADLRVNENTKSPLLCIAKVHDIASGKLSLPGRANID
jgi:hypothetical protein